MAAPARLALLLAVSLLGLLSATAHGCHPYCPSPATPTPPTTPPGGGDDCHPYCPSPATPPPPPEYGGGNCQPNCPSPVTPPPPPGGGNNDGSCPINALRLEVCANVLNLLRLNIGVPADEQCCPLLEGLVDLDAAVCLCLAIRANILGIVLNVPLNLNLLLNFCHKDRVPGFTCPN
ncbi:hypothetical protein ACP70R_020910 [Stipagrostis hirtigluma subsp. patula]